MNQDLDFSEKQKEFLKGLFTEAFFPLERKVNRTLNRKKKDYYFQLISKRRTK